MTDEKFSRYYKVTATDENQLNMLERLFVIVEYLGVIGASRLLELYVDGDGPINLKFKTMLENETMFKDLDYDTVMASEKGYGDIKETGDHQYRIDLG